MRTTVGIFKTLADAKRAVQALEAEGLPAESINLLTPGAIQESLSNAPKTDSGHPTRQDLGTALGGALGAAGGLTLGAAAAFLIPGVGPVIAAGLAGAALLGTGGALGGALVGRRLDQAAAAGLPEDELFVYEDALRRGQSVVVVVGDDVAQANRARAVFRQSGAETIDNARTVWWNELRAAEAAAYEARGGDFAQDEEHYRAGFEVALRRRARGQSYEEAAEYLQQCAARICTLDPFQRGYERGQAYYQSLARRSG